MTDNRGWKILGRHTPLGLIFFDEITIKDMFSVDDIVYATGRAMLVVGNPYHRNGRKMVDVTAQYVNSGSDIDETHEAMREATR
jgi:hypothetical protein